MLGGGGLLRSEGMSGLSYILAYDFLSFDQRLGGKPFGRTGHREAL